MVELTTLVSFLVLATAVLALAVYLSAKLVERRNPPVGEFLHIDGTRLHYVERGTGGLPVVFLHGNATMLQDFTLSEVVSSAAMNSQVIIFDRPGFGYSTRPRGRTWSASEQADLIAAALGLLKVGPVTLVGHSWGTLVAVALAERHPTRVRSLVLLAGYYYPTPRLTLLLRSSGRRQSWVTFCATRAHHCLGSSCSPLPCAPCLGLVRWRSRLGAGFLSS